MKTMKWIDPLAIRMTNMVGLRAKNVWCLIGLLACATCASPQVPHTCVDYTPKALYLRLGAVGGSNSECLCELLYEEGMRQGYSVFYDDDNEIMQRVPFPVEYGEVEAKKNAVTGTVNLELRIQTNYDVMDETKNRWVRSTAVVPADTRPDPSIVKQLFLEVMTLSEIVTFSRNPKVKCMDKRTLLDPRPAPNVEKWCKDWGSDGL